MLISTEDGCRMQALTPDGLTGASWCSPGGNASKGFEWTDEDGFEIMTGTWLLAPTDTITAASDISADGRCIVGRAGNTGNGVPGMRWDDGAPTSLTDLLASTGVATPSWSLSSRRRKSRAASRGSTRCRTPE